MQVVGDVPVSQSTLSRAFPVIFAVSQNKGRDWSVITMNWKKDIRENDKIVRPNQTWSHDALISLSLKNRMRLNLTKGQGDEYGIIKKPRILRL